MEPVIINPNRGEDKPETESKEPVSINVTDGDQEIVTATDSNTNISVSANPENSFEDLDDPGVEHHKEILPPLAIPAETVGTKRGKKRKIFALVVIALLVFSGAGAYVLLDKDRSESTNKSAETVPSASAEIKTPVEPQPVEQVFIHPKDGTKTSINKTTNYTVIVGATEYYGRVSIINSEYLSLLPTAYKKAKTLTFTGQELHGPEAATYFKISNVVKLQELTDKTIIDAIAAANSTVLDAFPSDAINKYVKTGQFQAYFFADGAAFFAKATSLDGTFLKDVKYVYVLRTNTTTTQAKDISLVLAKPDQYNKLTTASLLYWQNMKSDSQITKAATEFEKQKP